MDNNRKVVELPLDDVLPNRFQPRIKFNEDSINELSESIKEHGVIQPIVVRPVGDRYEIIAGERRYKAATLAGLQTIPAIITDLNDKDSAEVALIENVQRQDLTPIEEAISYKKILDMGYLTQENLAEKLGKNQSTVANKLRLLNLDEEVQEALLNEKISERHARSLLKLSDYDDQVNLLNRIISERLTVRKTDEEINKMLNNQKEAKPNNIEVLDMEEPIIIPEEEISPLESSFNIPTTPIFEQSAEDNNPVSFDFPKFNENIFEETIPVEDKNLSAFGFPNIEETQSLSDVSNSIEENNNFGFDFPKFNENTFEESMSVEDTGIPTFESANFEETQSLSDVSNSIEENNNFGFDFNNLNENNLMNDNLTETATVSDIEQEDNIPKFSDLLKQAEEESDDDVSDDTQLIPSKFFNILDETEFDEPAQDGAKKESTINDINSDFSNMFNSSNNIIENDLTVSPNFGIPTFEDESFNFESKQEEVISAPTGNNAFVTGDIKTVINTIRNCTDTIEKYGFKVDSEEFDLEDMYQVIIKIQKK